MTGWGLMGGSGEVWGSDLQDVLVKLWRRSRSPLGTGSWRRVSFRLRDRVFKSGSRLLRSVNSSKSTLFTCKTDWLSQGMDK